jgi:hypothetical protein
MRRLLAPSPRRRFSRYYASQAFGRLTTFCNVWLRALVSSAFPPSLSYGRISVEYASDRREIR